VCVLSVCYNLTAPASYKEMIGKLYSNGIHVYTKCDLCNFAFLIGLHVNLLEIHIYCYKVDQSHYRYGSA